MLRSQGGASTVFASHCLPDKAKNSRPIIELGNRKEDAMHRVDFPEWRAILGSAELPEEWKRSYPALYISGSDDLIKIAMGRVIFDLESTGAQPVVNSSRAAELFVSHCG